MRTFTTALICLLVAIIVPAAQAQEYGVGETVIVPQAPDTLTIDGVINPDVWDTGASFDLLANPSWWSDDFPQDITDAYAQVLYVEDTLGEDVAIMGPSSG